MGNRIRETTDKLQKRKEVRDEEKSCYRNNRCNVNVFQFDACSSVRDRLCGGG